MRLNLIYAQSQNGVIGINNTLPWHLPQDLAHFKAKTSGSPVIMGRKTWDSLPPKFRPLPGRTNIVITRQHQWQADGAHATHSLEAALRYLKSSTETAPEEIWVIGGAQIYTAALPLAQRVVVTVIHKDFQGDAYAPTLGPEWRETAREPHNPAPDAADALSFDFVTFER
jgi:dihydrofolate reductase